MEPTLSDLSRVINLGPALAAELRAAGICDLSELVSHGSLGAAHRIAQTGSSVCANKLYALEGAIRGVRWHAIPSTDRASLWQQFQQVDDG